MRWVMFRRGKEEPPSCSPNQDFVTGFTVQEAIAHGRHKLSSCYIRLLLEQCQLSLLSQCKIKWNVCNSCMHDVRASAHILSLCMCVCCVQGHGRSGEVQDHHNSLLQRSHGERRTPAEQADWIIRLTSLPLCARSVPFTDSLNPFSLSLPLRSVAGHHPGVRHHGREVLRKHSELDEEHQRSESLSTPPQQKKARKDLKIVLSHLDAC